MSVTPEGDGRDGVSRSPISTDRSDAEAVRELRLENVAKSYGGVHALKPTTTTFSQGLTGIVGDNGAGKSTLMKILSGVLTPDVGAIWLNDNRVSFSSPIAAKRAGVESLYQELALAETLDVTGNIFLGREITRNIMGIRVLKHREMAAAARMTLKQVQINIPDVTSMVRSLSGGQRQAVAMARAVHFNAPIILLDEPTAALGPRETASVNTIIDHLVEQGKLVIMVTHNIPQILARATRIIVMRAGRIVWEVDPRQTSEEELMSYMVGTRTVTNG
jgi:simple sugar transport system ATP-binding protein